MHHMVIALKSFEGQYEKRFNFSKLTSYLRLSESDARTFLNFLLGMQDEFKEFSRVFEDRELSVKREGGTTFLTASKIYTEIPKTIILKKEQVGWLSDLIFAFQHVKKGKGFDIKNNDTELIKHLRLLMDDHPYFFVKNGSDLIYPSRLASELGSMLLTYKKLNKRLDTIEILNSNIQVEK